MKNITAILKEEWNTSQQTEDKREKIQALSLAKECYSMKLDLLTNATVVDDAIRFVAERGYKESKEIAVILDGDKHLNIKVPEVSKENINMITNKRAF